MPRVLRTVERSGAATLVTRSVGCRVGHTQWEIEEEGATARALSPRQEAASTRPAAEQRDAPKTIAEAAADARAPIRRRRPRPGRASPRPLPSPPSRCPRGARHLSDRRTMATRISPLAGSPERDPAPGQPGSEGWPQRYRIRGRLRRPSGRPVLLAVDRTDGRLVVIKGDAGGGGAQHEAEILARLAHPNIVALRDRIERTGASYLVIDYVDAGSLDDHLAEHGGRLSPAALTRLLLELCDAVSHVHAQGLLHRDLKPANVLVRAEGTPVLVDFSAALPLDRQAEPREFSPSPPRRAGAICRGSGRRPWTDVLGLGALAYRAFTGKLAGSRARAAARPGHAARGRAGGRRSAELAAAIDWALALDPAARPQSIEEWREALAGVAPRPAGPHFPRKRTTGRRRFASDASEPAG